MDESLQGLIDIDRTIGRLTNEGRHALATYRHQMGTVIGSD